MSIFNVWHFDVLGLIKAMVRSSKNQGFHLKESLLAGKGRDCY